MKPVSLNMVRDDKGRFVRNTAPTERNAPSQGVITAIIYIIAFAVIGWEAGVISAPYVGVSPKPDYSNLTVTLSDGYVTPPAHVGTCTPFVWNFEPYWACATVKP